MLGLSQPSGDRLEALKQQLADLHQQVLDERNRTRVMAVAWHETRHIVTHLNNALRRKNRRIKRQKEIIAELRRAADAPAPQEKA